MANVVSAVTSVTAVTAAVVGVAKIAGLGSKKTTGAPPGIIPNPLSSYASWNYIISLGILSPDDVNDPSNVIKGTVSPLWILHGANAEPNNRVRTPYGQFDFFIDDLEITCALGLENGNNTNMSKYKFKVIEPYSMGLFLLAWQTGAVQLNWINWRTAPLVLKIEFRGNTETGTLSSTIPNTTRFFIISLAKITTKVTGAGAEHYCEATGFIDGALNEDSVRAKQDASLTGSTVQEILQTGDQSLQVVLNQHQKTTTYQNGLSVPSKTYIITFPDDITAGNAGNKTTTTSSATADPTASVLTKVGVQKTKPVVSGNISIDNYAQNTTVNQIGLATMGFDVTFKTPVYPLQKNNLVYNAKAKTFNKAKNTTKIKASEFRFSQDQKIEDMINEVILSSQYAAMINDPQNIDDSGFKGLWRIDCQKFIIQDPSNVPTTGDYPEVLVYRVKPYDSHSSKAAAPNTGPIGIKNYANEIIKSYNYIFTGKNTEILNFEVAFSTLMYTAFGSQSPLSTQDYNNLTNTTPGKDTSNSNKTNQRQLADGNLPVFSEGIENSLVKYNVTNSNTTGKGGGGTESVHTKIARTWFDLATANQSDMMVLDMTIQGDPHFLIASGFSNFVSPPLSRLLNSDGSANWQGGEYHINITFQTPIDINQTTGLYNFGKSKTAPIILFSGFYSVSRVVNRFVQGKFTQQLLGNRIVGVHNPNTATPNQILNSSTVDTVKGVTSTSSGASS